MSSQHDIEGKVLQTWNSGGKWVVIALALALVGWGGYGIIKSQQLKREEAAFSDLYKIESTYLERKSKMEIGEMLQTQKAEDLGLPPEMAKDAVEKTGDVEKDFGDVISDLKSFLTTHPSTQAAAVAGLWLMDIYSAYDQWEQASASLTEITQQLKSNTVMVALLEMSAGTALAEAGQCTEALQHWNNILNKESMSYLHGEAALRAGLCLEHTGALEEAASKYRMASEKAVEGSSVASSAEQFLRALELAPPTAPKKESM